MKYSKLLRQLKTPQLIPIPFAGQTRNAAGGYAWEVDRWTMLDRFLILGSETGTYYIGEHKLTMDHAQNVIEAIQENGLRVVQRIVEVSREGRAPKNDPAIFALALAASFGDEKTRATALGVVSLVCRTGTHLFAFAQACREFRGWGRGLRKAVGRWYSDQTPESLTYSLVKYQARNGWSNRDLLRLAHPKPVTEEHGALYRFALRGEEAQLPLLQAVLALRKVTTAQEAAALIREFRIPREAVPTEFLTERAVWDALLQNMPLTATIRNLGNMTKVGLLQPDSEATAKVIETLRNQEALRKARIHPVGVLAALVTYESGSGQRGSGKWTPVPRIVDALSDAFYATFGNVEATGKRFVLGLDVSGSMEGTLVNGIPGLDCRRAAGAMALVTAAVEPKVTHLAFDTDVYPLNLSARQRLDDVTRTLARTGGGGTDCAAPIAFALKHRIEADVFVIYTDSETWYGTEHPSQAMQRYRSKMGINAKLVVVAMASNRTTIGDPRDKGVMNVVGFDTTVPQAIAGFVG